MEQYIPKSAVLAEIEKRITEYKALKIDSSYYVGMVASLEFFRDEYINTLEVKEADNTLNIRFPHYKSIVEKVFGAGNLESFEYNEAEQLVSLAKEELLKDLEVKEVDLEKEYKDFVEEDPVYNKLVNGIVGKAIAKHFFELGLKAQKGE